MGQRLTVQLSVEDTHSKNALRRVKALQCVDFPRQLCPKLTISICVLRGIIFKRTILLLRRELHNRRALSANHVAQKMTSIVVSVFQIHLEVLKYVHLTS